MPDRLAWEIAELEALDAAALRCRWVETFGKRPPKQSSRALLLRALAYHVQEQALGGLSKAVRRRLAALADPRAHARAPAPITPKPLTGTRLVRSWGGEVHQVSVLADGFEYRGKIYASLSEIARRITGTRWSGPRFFGLRKGAGSDNDR